MERNGLERVMDYPRPPRLERDRRRVRVVLGGQGIVDTTDTWRVLETTHPPSFYIPMTAFPPGALVPSARGSVCEWKGAARYWSITAGGRTARDAAWGYPDPTPAFAGIKDHVALYAGMMDACFVDEDRVVPQEGGFYGGWITPELIGPFKGGPGTMFW